MKETKRTALVVGAQGVIGRNLIDYLSTLEDWNIVGLSRRPGEDSESIRYISVDLLDAEDSNAKLRELTDVTHVFYAAYQERPTWAELVAPNLGMLQNVIEHIEPIAAGLVHVSLMQGYKVYGAHLGPFKTPAKESDPNHMPPEFNIDQQNYLERRQAGKNWTWSAIRPSVVCGFALGNPMNLAMVIAVYAAMSKELEIPLRFPGKPGAYDKLIEMTDAGLLAKATVWAATEPRWRIKPSTSTTETFSAGKMSLKKGRSKYLNEGCARTRLRARTSTDPMPLHTMSGSLACGNTLPR